ncbi:MAG: hypothetical protein GC165_12710 [Armatimonadetes bacterium]|nr:hypothetical protein [Armatimonadota bacterium]MBS1726055.1 hypothetical protein [Armatimonadota bacterium]
MPDKIWSNASTALGAQNWDTGWFAQLFTLIFMVFIVVNIVRARSKKELFIRRIPGLNAIDEAVGRATEMGRPILMVPGLSDPVNAIAVQAINICAYVTRTAAKFSNPILMCAYSASMYTLAQEVIRDVYQEEGVPERYDPDSVRFISDRQFAFAAGVSGIIHREQTAAAFFLGEFYAESLIFAETANSIGAIQVASSTEATQTPFFIAACDYVLIGDEFYAASAYLTREPVLVGSLIGQDWAKVFAIGCILCGALSQSIVSCGHAKNVENAVAQAAGSEDAKKANLAKVKEDEKKVFAFSKLFRPDDVPDDVKEEVKKSRTANPDAPAPTPAPAAGGSN